LRAALGGKSGGEGDEEERLERFLERSLDKEPGLQVTQPHERAEHAEKQRRAGPEERRGGQRQ